MGVIIRWPFRQCPVCCNVIVGLDGGELVMARAHRALPVYGVQFLLSKVLELAQAAWKARGLDELSFGGGAGK